MTALQMRGRSVALVLILVGCGGTDPRPEPSPPPEDRYSVTGTFTLDTTRETVGPPRGTITTVTTINVPFAANLTVRLPYGASVEAALAVTTCNVCEAMTYSTALHVGPHAFTDDSVDLQMTLPSWEGTRLRLRGIRVGDTVTGTMNTFYTTSTTYLRSGTFTAVRH